MSNFNPYRGGGHRRGRGRRRGFGPPKPSFEELQTALRAEFPSDTGIVDSVLSRHNKESLESLRRLVRDRKYAHEVAPRNEFEELSTEYREYLERFQVSFCLGNCVRSRCLFFHKDFHKDFDKAIRRKPQRHNNGVWRYLPTLCMEEGCAEEICSFAHCPSEIMFHPMTYKTEPCSYALTADETCKKYGYHCPFVHEELDGDGLPGFPYNLNQPEMKPPVCDTVEKQRDYNETMRQFSDSYVTLTEQRKNRIAELPQEKVDNDAAFARETYKVLPCQKYACKRDEKCLHYHTMLERRREWDTKYSQQPCGYVFDEVTNRFGDPFSCPAGDACEYAHTENEVFFHRTVYQRKPCLNFLQLSSCPHPHCPFVHERGASARLPEQLAPAAPPPREEHKLQQPDMATVLQAKTEEVKRNMERLQKLVAEAEAELLALQSTSKCSVCRQNDHLYALLCGHTICGGCADKGIKLKLHFCKKCNRPSKGLIRFAE